MPDPGDTGSGPRMLIHWAYVLLVFLLAATGCLLYFPELRSSLTSGYSLVIGKTHRYAGILAIPVLAVYGVFLLRSRGLATRWQKAHTDFVALTGGLFIVSGLVLWVTGMAGTMREVLRVIHDILAVMVLIGVAAHLAALRRSARS